MGAAILDRKSWGPPSWIGSRGGRHLGSDVVGAAILVSWGPPSWTGSDVKNAIVGPILLTISLLRFLHVMYDALATTYFIGGAVRNSLESVHLLRLDHDSFSLTKTHITHSISAYKLYLQNGGRKLWFSRVEFSTSRLSRVSCGTLTHV